MLLTLMTNWSQLFSYFLTLWVLIWGIRAVLTVLVLGSLVWLFRQHYHGH